MLFVETANNFIYLLYVRILQKPIEIKGFTDKFKKKKIK